MDGVLMDNVKDEMLCHSNHTDKFKSKKLFDNRIPIEQVISHKSKMEEMLRNYEVSSCPKATEFITAIEIAFFNGTKLDNHATKFVRNLYLTIIRKGKRILSTSEMIEEIANNTDKYHHKITYDDNDKTQVINYSITLYTVT